MVSAGRDGIFWSVMSRFAVPASVAEWHPVAEVRITVAQSAGNVFVRTRFEQRTNQTPIDELRLLSTDLQPRVQSSHMEHPSCFLDFVSEGKTEMLQQIDQPAVQPAFQDRRNADQGSEAGRERRQFRDGNRSARPEVAELADAVDDYKSSNRRRFITFEELFDVMQGLGYHK